MSCDAYNDSLRTCDEKSGRSFPEIVTLVIALLSGLLEDSLDVVAVKPASEDDAEHDGVATGLSPSFCIVIASNADCTSSSDIGPVPRRVLRGA